MFTMKLQAFTVRTKSCWLYRSQIVKIEVSQAVVRSRAFAEEQRA